MGANQTADGNPTRQPGVARWVAMIAGLSLWLVGVPLVHGVLPWALSWLTAHHGWIDGHPGPWNLLGFIPVGFGASVLLWDLATGLTYTGQIPARVTEVASPFLITRGPHAFTRNPMYIAELALWIGWALLYGSAAVLIGLVVLATGIFTVVPREERGLEARFGTSYREYKRSVPRWLGRRAR